MDQYSNSTEIEQSENYQAGLTVGYNIVSHAHTLAQMQLRGMNNESV